MIGRFFVPNNFFLLKEIHESVGFNGLGIAQHLGVGYNGLDAPGIARHLGVGYNGLGAPGIARHLDVGYNGLDLVRNVVVLT